MKATAEKSTTTTSATQVQAKPFFAKAGGGDFFAPAKRGASLSVQTKLTVNKPGDKFEQEADQMAARVMRAPVASAGKEKGMLQTGNRIQRATLPDEKVQKATLPEEKVQKEALPEEKVQKKNHEVHQENNTGTTEPDESAQTAIRSKTSGGAPLPRSVRNFMEPRFGNDFSNVRVHNDQESGQLNKQLNARAFTFRNHIFFGAGQYQPESPGGKQLLAHELTHVVQQGASQQLNQGTSEHSAQSNVDPTLENSAHAGTPAIQRSIPGAIAEGISTLSGALGDVINNISRVIGTGITNAAAWIRGLAARVGSGLVAAWGWISNLAGRIGMGVVTAWNWIQGIASQIGMAVSSAWSWVQALATHIGMSLLAGWHWIQSIASRIGRTVREAWAWLQSLAVRFGLHTTLAWHWIQIIAATAGMMIVQAWNFIQLVTARIGMMILQSWLWLQMMAAALGMRVTMAWAWIQGVVQRIGMMVITAWIWIQTLALRVGMIMTAAWQWIQTVAAQTAMMLVIAWQWILGIASRLGTIVTRAWNWIKALAARLGRAILAAWQYIVMIALRMAMRLVQAWNWLVNLAKRVAVAIANAWDWWLHAPDISIETLYAAPDGSGKSRHRTGVGERVTFTGSKTGTWRASGGAPRTLASGLTFVWTAPTRAATITISLKSGKYTRIVTMTVLEPNAITAQKKEEMNFRRGRMGAGMKLKFHYHPKTVSFGNIDAMEVSGPATNIRGYFEEHAGDYHHDSGDTFFPVNHDNVDSATDTAAFWGYPAPWRRGGYDWVIPNKFKVRTEAGDGKKFTDVTQAFSILGRDGTAKVTKGGEEAERTP